MEEKIIELDANDIDNLDKETESKKLKDDTLVNYKRKYKRSRILNIVLSIVIVLILSVLTIFSLLVYTFYRNAKPFFRGLLGKNFSIASVSQLSKNNAIDLEKFTTKLAFIDDVINIMYYYDKDNSKIEDAMFSAYAKSLGDKYAEYFPRKEFEEFTEKTTEGVYYGIGCLVNQDRKTKDCIVNTVYENSPAEKGGVMKDDIFVSIDGVNVRGSDLEDIISKIRGEEGAKREIVVYRPSIDQNVSLTVYCGKVDIKLVSSEIYEGNIGYLNVDEFTGKASSQFKEEINKLLKQNITGLIIDLRSNPGGELITVCEMMDYMVKDKDGKYTMNQKEEVFDVGKTLLVYIKEKDEIVDAAYAEDRHEVDIPIVILTDQGTASAAELFTECLRDYNKATIVGTRTYGKGVVQNIIPYEDGSAIKFTVSEYFPPSGYSIDIKGIIPDYSLDYAGIEVNYDEENHIVIYEDNTMTVFNRDGSIMNEVILPKATESDIATSSDIEEEHIENLKIYDDDNEFLNEDWFVELDGKYDDKQLLQAIVILRQNQ